VYNIRGQRIKTLVNDHFPAGRHSAVWNGTDDNGRVVSSGVYFYRMTAGEFTETRRMLLMK
jgi:flagellar hook assembly protein FlgD